MSSSNDALLHDLEEELHELCQPLTALHFRLEMGKVAGDGESLREAVDGALGQTARMIRGINRMRERVTEMKAVERSEESSESSCGSLCPVVKPRTGVNETNGDGPVGIK